MNKKLSAIFNNVIVVCCIVLMPYLAAGQDEWIDFSAEEPFAFSVAAPAELTMKSKVIKTGIGELVDITYAYQDDETQDNYLYVINLVQYPDGTFPVDSTDLISEFLESAIGSLSESVGGEIVYSSDHNEASNGQGKIFRLKYNDDFVIIKGKTFVKDDLFITLQVYTTENLSLNDAMDEFLDSFQMKS